MSGRRPKQPTNVGLIQTPHVQDVDTARAVKTLTDAVNRLRFNNLLKVDVGSTFIGARPEINFIAGTNITLSGTDNLADERIDITITAASGGGAISDGDKGDVVVSGAGTVWLVPDLALKVNTTRLINTTSPITGGGDLSADRTIAFDQTVVLNNNARLAVRKNSTGGAVGTRRQLNLIEGANITLTVADDAGNEEVDVTIAAAAAAPTITSVELDFGSTPVDSASFVVVDASVSSTSKVMIVQSGTAATARNADESEMDPIAATATPAAGQFTARCHALKGRVTGKYKFNYQVGA